MTHASETRLNPLRLRRLRRALAADDQVQSRTRPHARRVALSMFAALFVGIAGLAWHGTNAAPLSTTAQFASRTSRFVSPAERAAHAAVVESMKMQRMATIQAAALGAAVLVTSAHAQNSGYARFDQTSDTIRILGNTVFAQGDFTYEARIRFLAGSPRGSIIWEQRIGTEDKNLQLGPNGDYLASGCAGSSGNVTGNLGAVPEGQWIHVAYVHEGSLLKFYIDGLLRASRTFNSCYGDAADSWMSIGMFRQQFGTDRASFLGDLDWIRVSSGARYTSDFTPPYECEVTADASTQLLLKFNEPAGTTTLIDESASQFQCQIGVHVQTGASASSPTLGNTDGGFPACAPLCPGDIDENTVVDGVDLAIVLGRWGTNPKDYPRADTNDDGTVDGADLAQVLGMWGACP
ncbi:MAG: hypothetical protein QM516_00150 [Limnohabitans sp.]|nr:hypothetical protein [Limnohabitans sp.]